MKNALVMAFVGLASSYVMASSDDPQTPQELEQFYGAKYVSLTTEQTDRLARAAIKAQKTGICNIHHVKMKKEQVPMIFGLPDSSNPYYSNELAYFPHAREYTNGGCEIEPTRQKKLYPQFMCPECKRAERQWARTHPKNAIAREILARQ
jgi:uncharacterized protein YlaI